MTLNTKCYIQCDFFFLVITVIIVKLYLAFNSK